MVWQCFFAVTCRNVATRHKASRLAPLPLQILADAQLIGSLQDVHGLFQSHVFGVEEHGSVV